MKRTIFLVVLCAVVAVPAMADQYGTISVNETGYHDWKAMTVHYTGAVSDGRSVVTGVYELTLSGYAATGNAGDPVLSSAAAGMLTGEVDAFCIDIWDWSPSVAQPYDVRTLDDAPNAMGGGPVMGEEKAARLAELLNTHWNDALDTSVKGAALQAAVWEIVAEDLPSDPADYNLSSGKFYLTGSSDVINLANGWLDSISAIGQAFGGYVAVSNPTTAGALATYQDYVVRVPVPGAVLLGMLGLGYAGLRLRKTV